MSTGTWSSRIRCKTFNGMDRHVINTHCSHLNHHNHHKLSFLKSAFFCVTCLMDASGQPLGAAQRRRQRRMRSWWRHEQASIAAAVPLHHHSAQRSGGVVRRSTGTEDSGNREELEHATLCGPGAQKNSPTGRAAGHPRGARAAEK